MADFYVYIHTRNDTGEVFYVGKGLKHRPHESTSRNKHWHNIVKKHGRSVVILETFESESDAFSMERYLIASYLELGIRLVNQTAGGDGKYGWKASDETRKKISDAHMGKSYSPETIERMRIAQKGKKLSDETRARMSAYRTGKPLSEETKSRLSAALKGKVRTPEMRAQMSITYTGRKHTPEAIAKITEASKRHAANRRGLREAAFYATLPHYLLPHPQETTRVD